MASKSRSSPVDDTEEMKEEGDEEEEVELIEEPHLPSSQKRLHPSSSSKQARQPSTPSRSGPSKRPRTTPKLQSEYADPTASDEEEDRQKLLCAKAGPSNEDLDELDDDDVDSLVGEVKPKPKREKKPKELDPYVYDSDGEKISYDDTYVMPRKPPPASESKIHKKEKGKSTWSRKSGPRKWKEDEAILFYRAFQKVPLSQPSPFQVVWYLHGEFGKLDQRLRQFHPSGHMNEKMKTILKVRQNQELEINGNARRYLKDGHPLRIEYEEEREKYNKAQEDKEDEVFKSSAEDDDKEEEKVKDDKKKDKAKGRVSTKKPDSEGGEDGDEEAKKVDVGIRVNKKKSEQEDVEDGDEKAKKEKVKSKVTKRKSETEDAADEDNPVEAKQQAKKPKSIGQVTEKSKEEKGKGAVERKKRQHTPNSNGEEPANKETSEDSSDEEASQRERSTSQKSATASPPQSPRLAQEPKSTIPTSPAQSSKPKSKPKSKTAVPVVEVPLPRSTRSRSRMLESESSQNQQTATSGENKRGGQGSAGNTSKARTTGRIMTRPAGPIIDDDLPAVSETSEADDDQGAGEGEADEPEAGTTDDEEQDHGGMMDTQEEIQRTILQTKLILGDI